MRRGVCQIYANWSHQWKGWWNTWLSIYGFSYLVLSFSYQLNPSSSTELFRYVQSSFPNNFLHQFCLHFQKLFVAKRKNDEKTNSRGFIGSRHEWKHDNLRGPLVTTLLLLLSAAWGLFWALLHLQSRIIRYGSFYYLQNTVVFNQTVRLSASSLYFSKFKVIFSSPSLLAGIIFWTSTFALACVVKMSILLWRWIPFRFEHDVEKVQQRFSVFWLLKKLLKDFNYRFTMISVLLSDWNERISRGFYVACVRSKFWNMGRITSRRKWHPLTPSHSFCPEGIT